MLWADRLAEKIVARYARIIGAGTPLIVRDEKTASGRVHVGSMRGVAIHGALSEVLTERGIAHRFLYEINDVDPFDDIPQYLDTERYRPYLFRPLYSVPAPEGTAENYAEYYGREFESVILDAGFRPEFYRARTLYERGDMDEVVRAALTRADLIRDIYKRVSGSVKEVGWLPISVLKHECPLGEAPRAVSFDGKTVGYVCVPIGEKHPRRGAKEGSVDPFRGGSKLSWKVDWAAKWKAVGVHIEGGGKDHATKGGARDVAEHISREVFEYEPPFDIPYEFFLVGGQKMSSSKGRGSSAREIADLLPQEIFRLALLMKEPVQAINFEPEGDTIPVLFDTYDRLAENYFAGVDDDRARLFVLAHAPETREHLRKRFLPRFREVVFLVQMPHLSLEEEVARLKGSALSDDDRAELGRRAHYARLWIEMFAPEAYRFELKREALPERARALSAAQKAALSDVLAYVEAHETLDGQALHTELHAIKTRHAIEPNELFGALYESFLGKSSGPKAGWFLSVLERDFLIRRLREAAE